MLVEHFGRAVGELFMPRTKFNWVVTQFSTLAGANECEKNSSRAGRKFLFYFFSSPNLLGNFRVVLSKVGW